MYRKSPSAALISFISPAPPHSLTSIAPYWHFDPPHPQPNLPPISRNHANDTHMRIVASPKSSIRPPLCIPRQGLDVPEALLTHRVRILPRPPSELVSRPFAHGRANGATVTGRFKRRGAQRNNQGSVGWCLPLPGLPGCCCCALGSSLEIGYPRAHLGVCYGGVNEAHHRRHTLRSDMLVALDLLFLSRNGRAHTRHVCARVPLALLSLPMLDCLHARGTTHSESV